MAIFVRGCAARIGHPLPSCWTYVVHYATESPRKRNQCAIRRTDFWTNRLENTDTPKGVNERTTGMDPRLFVFGGWWVFVGKSGGRECHAVEVRVQIKKIDDFYRLLLTINDARAARVQQASFIFGIDSSNQCKGTETSVDPRFEWVRGLNISGEGRALLQAQRRPNIHRVCRPRLGSCFFMRQTAHLGIFLPYGWAS